MARYQVVYSKRGYPLVQWHENEADARKAAKMWRDAGYDVDVWVHTATGARKVDI